MPKPRRATIEHSISWTASSGQVYTLHLTLIYSIDRGYGADADGNRGSVAYFPEDAQIDYNPFTLSEMGLIDHDEWCREGPSLDSMIDQAWDEAEIN